MSDGRIDKEVLCYSWRVDVCHDDGWWAAYHGKRSQSANDDDFTGWLSSVDELLYGLADHLPRRVYAAVARAVDDIEAAERTKQC